MSFLNFYVASLLAPVGNAAMSSAANAEELQQQAASQEAAALLEQLCSLPGVSGVNAKPVSTADKLNHFGVSYKLRIVGGDRKSKRSAVTEPDGDRPTFIAAVKQAINSTTAELREHGVEVRTVQCDADQPPTEEELHWLAEWVDEQLAPEAVTLEQASAALAARRSCPAGSSHAGSSHAGSSSASTGFIRLYEVQLQRAKLSAAQRKLQLATAYFERLQAVLPKEQRR